MLVLLSSNLFAHKWMAPQKAARQQNPIDSSEISVALGKLPFYRTVPIVTLKTPKD